MKDFKPLWVDDKGWSASTNGITISQRDNHLIIYNHGEVMSKINDSYNKLKYYAYGGNRIFFKWSDESEIQETYDDRIFNCTYKGKTIQIRDSNELCDAIKDKDETAYATVFKKSWLEENKSQLIGNLVKNSFGDRVTMNRDGSYIVDNMFMVDKNASAHVRIGGKNKWKYLCVVVKRLHKKKLDLGEIGKVELEPKLIEILAKINFLLHPKLKDRIFMQQLPKEIKEELQLTCKN